MSFAFATGAALIMALPAPQAADQLLDVRPFSLVGPHTATPDGSHFFLGEGASIAFIEPMAPVLDPPTGLFVSPRNIAEVTQNFATPLKRQAIGEECPHAVDLLLDPDFDLETSANVGDPNYANMLIIAAGANGLWVMDADPTSTNARVARVDDSGPSLPQE